ncbi:hypothetical protein CLAFUW4_06084 [Fulvia fulva]|uniref:Uncharacterized protein n=1 Tax=Passalora fulva TaxID=5499 RepID=A0A9Q8LIM2_PASFU|nr:uncharacterized protein CLAFUR5_06228 [Fulvia fulva]UJO18070.1 hypothetical protein CLAFUR5_06228 [Fulvia fulva]WPV15184.1 hypothetical protein CLAFUW4_06084 [Fulvia fulva]
MRDRKHDIQLPGMKRFTSYTEYYDACRKVCEEWTAKTAIGIDLNFFRTLADRPVKEETNEELHDTDDDVAVGEQELLAPTSVKKQELKVTRSRSAPVDNTVQAATPKQFLYYLYHSAHRLIVDDMYGAFDQGSFVHRKLFRRSLPGGVPAFLEISTAWRCLMLASYLIWIAGSKTDCSPADQMDDDTEHALAYPDLPCYIDYADKDDAFYDVMYGLWLRGLVSESRRWFNESRIRRMVGYIGSEEEFKAHKALEGWCEKLTAKAGLPKRDKDDKAVLWGNIWMKALEKWLRDYAGAKMYGTFADCLKEVALAMIGALDTI